MADYDVKAVAAALREQASLFERQYKTSTWPNVMRARADELDPPPPVKSRADRIVDGYFTWLRSPGSGNCEDVLRRILKEEGIE